MLQFTEKKDKLKREDKRGTTKGIGIIEVKCNDNNDNIMWIDKYRPKSTSELAMHKAKVDKIKTWIVNATNDKERNNINIPSVLCLCGASGTCKSTAVEVICSELGISIIEWADDNWDMEPYINKDNNIKISANDYLSDNFDENNNNFLLKQRSLSMVQDLIGDVNKYSRMDNKFNEFILESSYPSLNFNKLNLDKKVSMPQKKRRTNNDNIISLISSDDDSDGFNDENISHRHSNKITKNSHNKKKIVLINDPSFLSSKGTKSGLELQELLLSFRLPVVIIISDVSGKDDEKYNLDKFLSQAIRDQLNFESIYCQNITDINISKILSNILLKERVSKDTYKPELLRNVASKSMGDLRNAIMQLQIMIVNRRLSIGTYASDIGNDKNMKENKKKTKHDKDNDDDNNYTDNSEIKGIDIVYSPLHALGKVVNAKLNANGMLEFDPDQVMDRTDMAKDMMVNFMQWNVISSVSNSQRIVSFGSKDDNNDDMVQIYNSLRYFSDIDILEKAKYDPSAMLDRSDNSYPDEYIKAISSRAPSVSRGFGVKEKYELGKSRGACHMFIGMHRPKVIDLYHSRKRVIGNALLLRNELLLNEPCLYSGIPVNESYSYSPTMQSFDELIITVVPMLRVLAGVKERQQNLLRHQQQIIPLSDLICWRIRSLNNDILGGNGKIQISDSEKTLEEQKLLSNDDITDFDD